MNNSGLWSILTASAIVAESSNFSLDEEVQNIARRARNKKPSAKQRRITISEHMARKNEGKLRNKPCHCGSGIKLKKCCLINTPKEDK